MEIEIGRGDPGGRDDRDYYRGNVEDLVPGGGARGFAGARH